MIHPGRKSLDVQLVAPVFESLLDIQSEFLLVCMTLLPCKATTLPIGYGRSADLILDDCQLMKEGTFQSPFLKGMAYPVFLNSIFRFSRLHRGHYWAVNRC